MPSHRRRNRAQTAAAAVEDHPDPLRDQQHDQEPRIKPAAPWKRAYAAFIDLGLLALIYITLNAVTGGRFAHETAAPQDIFVFLAYFILFTGLLGRTPGKMVAGIKVVAPDGRAPGVAMAIPREVVGKLVSVLALGIGIIWLVFDEQRQGWHDKIAGTYVVDKP